jgi:hypothetical protein
MTELVWNKYRPIDTSRLTVADALAFQFRLHITDQRSRHPAFGGDGGRVVKRTVEVEIAGDIHIELTPALQAPFSVRPFASNSVCSQVELTVPDTGPKVLATSPALFRSEAMGLHLWRRGGAVHDGV